MVHCHTVHLPLGALLIWWTMCGTGETNFPKLNLTIPAKKGSACVWPSVLDSDPYQRDDRTDHQSLPVESGVKFGVNYWIHMWPFRTKSDSGCDNQAYIQNWY